MSSASADLIDSIEIQDLLAGPDADDKFADPTGAETDEIIELLEPQSGDDATSSVPTAIDDAT